MTQIALDEISQPLFAVSPHTACGFQQISLIAYPYGSGVGLVMATSLPLHFYSYTISQKWALVKCVSGNCCVKNSKVYYYQQNMNGANKEFYTAQDLSKVLQVNIMTIYRYIKAGKLRAYKIGKEFRIDSVEFKKFLDSVQTK